MAETIWAKAPWWILRASFSNGKLGPVRATAISPKALGTGGALAANSDILLEALLYRGGINRGGVAGIKGSVIVRAGSGNGACYQRTIQTRHYQIFMLPVSYRWIVADLTLKTHSTLGVG